MVLRSHRDGLGSASHTPWDCASGTTNVPMVGERGGTQGPSPGPVTASSISGSPGSGPLALAARFGGGLDWLGTLPATSSTTLPGGRLLLQRGSRGSRRGAPTATSRLRGCSWSGSSRFPTAHDVFNRLRCWEPVRHPPRNHIQPQRIGTWWRIPHEPNILGGPGKHSSHLWDWLGQSYHTE